MATVRTATLAARPTELANIALTAPASSAVFVALLTDRKTCIYRTFNNIAVSTNYGVAVTVGKNFNDSTWTPEGIIETPNGEVLVSMRKSTAAGEVWRSTGWNPATANATSWTRTLTAGGPGIQFNSPWGFNERCIAPAWSKHAGAIFIAEYGPQADTVATTDLGAVRVYMSTDDGLTWRIIFDVRDRWPGETRLHVHGVTYDPWNGRVLVSQGDGGNANVAHCGVWYTDDPTVTTPAWTLIAGTSTTTSIEQITTIAAFEAGLLGLPDGLPSGPRIIPRRGPDRYGQIRELMSISGYNDGPIGNTIYRIGGLATPQPGAPILMCASEPATGSGKPAIWISNDGIRYRELYRHTTGVSGGAPGFQRVSGPTIDGKIIAVLNLAGTSQLFTADYLPVPVTV